MKLAYSTPWTAMNAWFSRLQDYPLGYHPSLNVYSRKRKVYADNLIVYSYGNHFPLIRWIPEYRAFTINTDRYSNTTSRHQSNAESLTRQYRCDKLGEGVSPFKETKIFHLSYDRNTNHAWLPEFNSDQILAYYNEQIRCYAFKAKRARSDWSRSSKMGQAERWIAERNELIGRFAIPLSQCGVENALQLPEDVQAALVLMKLTEK